MKSRSAIGSPFAGGVTRQRRPSRKRLAFGPERFLQQRPDVVGKRFERDLAVRLVVRDEIGVGERREMGVREPQSDSCRRFGVTTMSFSTVNQPVSASASSPMSAASLWRR
jgi:hypothetical protein